MPNLREFDQIVIGGGFFGCSLALHSRRKHGRRVAVVEMGSDLLQRASYSNQARVHNGYHYPRSLLTALRCRVNFPRFIKDYASCIVSDFEKYYAVGNLFSSVTSVQFRTFIERIGAPIERAPRNIRELFNPDLVEDVFRVREFAFDAVRLKDMIRTQLAEHRVEVLLETEAHSVRRAADGRLELTCLSGTRAEQLVARSVLNCTYSRINRLLATSGLEQIPLKHELTEMALVEVPQELRGRAFTMMCGPFFSIMPFPPRNLHTLSHVRYTPHCSWRDDQDRPWVDPYERFRRARKQSSYPFMIRDASRYMPCLAACEYRDSIWEVKTVLPKSEVDDSRPVLYRRECGLPNLVCMMGGKIDNIYDLIEFEDAADATCAA